jgi:hypothetical protein
MWAFVVTMMHVKGFKVEDRLSNIYELSADGKEITTRPNYKD